MTTNQEAVEALAKALADEERDSNYQAYLESAKILASDLKSQGFTITRKPAMTDEELDWQRDLDLVKLNLEQLRNTHGFILTDGELDVLIKRVARVTDYFAKKYRG